MAPIEHLSADRLGDMVNAVRSNPPDLATLPRPHDDLLDAPEDDYSAAPAEEIYSAPTQEYSPPPPSAYVAPPAPEDPPPVKIAPDYTWEDSVPPPAQPVADIPAVAFEIPMPDVEFPAVPEPAPVSRAAKKKKKKGGRHRRPPSLKHFGRGMARSIRSALLIPRVVAMVGILGLLVVATTVLGVF